MNLDLLPAFENERENERCNTIKNQRVTPSHFSQTNWFLIFVPSAQSCAVLFQSYFKRSDQAAKLLGFVVFVFAQGSKDLKKRNFRKGVVSGRSAVCIMLTL